VFQDLNKNIVKYYVYSIHVYVCAYFCILYAYNFISYIPRDTQIRRTINSCKRHSVTVMMFDWKQNCFSGSCMTCYKVLDVVNALVCVLPVVHTPILSCYIIL